MVKRRPAEISAEARRRNLEQVARLGREIRESRLRRRLTQAQLGAKAGIARSTVGSLERGHGGGHTLDAWQRIALAVDRPLRIDLPRDALADTADAGHLRIQELVLRVGRNAGYARAMELPTRPAEPWRSADVVLRNDRRRRLLLVECWNTIGDVGAASRSTNRKLAELEAMAASLANEPYRAAAVWVVRGTRANRALVARYPEVFASRFPGSSLRWVRALTADSEPPPGAGLVWTDVDATRLSAMRSAS